MKRTNVVFCSLLLLGGKHYFIFELHKTFFKQTFLSWWFNLQLFSFHKYITENCFAPYWADNSSSLSWISKCSFWPGRRYFWVFHYFMSEMDFISLTQSKPDVYLINIWFDLIWFLPGIRVNLGFLELSSSIPQQMPIL